MRTAPATPVFALLLGAIWLLSGAGCAAPQPVPSAIDAPHYGEAWDAALEVLAQNKYRVLVADREQGFIETAPEREGSWLDPWYIPAHASPGEVTDALTAMQRRIVRVRFVATADGAAALPGLDPAVPLSGIAPPGSPATPPALSADPEQPTLVYWTTVIERKSQPNQNPNPWSGGLETSWRSQVVVQEAPAPGMAPIVRDTTPWVPIRTDNEESTRLGKALLRRLRSASPGA